MAVLFGHPGHIILSQGITMVTTPGHRYSSVLFHFMCYKQFYYTYVILLYFYLILQGFYISNINGVSLSS